MSDELDARIILNEKFYAPLLQKVKAEKKVNKEPLFVRFMTMTTNVLMNTLESVSVKSQDIPQNHLTILLENDWIRGGNRIDEYIITAKGLWEIETQLEIIDINKLVNIIDNKKFKMKIGGKLRDEDKVVTLTLIALRSFYDKTPVNRDLDNHRELINALNESIVFLKEMKSIPSKFVLSPPKSGEDPVTYVFRRTDGVPRSTRNLYQIGHRENYFALYNPETDEISEYNLGYLLWKVFGGDLTREDEKKIVSFCDDLLIKYKNYIYKKEDRSNFVFSDIKHKSIIESALFNIPDHKKVWEHLDG
ncbi:MAG: hypothetical protein PHF76_10950 [Bacteroidales bacterium]|nr:hypothetical protein [Bacteroidales bacterium]